MHNKTFPEVDNKSLILCTNLGKFEFGRQNLVHEEIGIIRPGSAIWLVHTPKVAQLSQEISFQVPYAGSNNETRNKFQVKPH